MTAAAHKKIESESNIVMRDIVQDDFESLRALYTFSLRNNAKGFIQDLHFHGDIADRAVNYQKNGGAMLGAFDAGRLIGCGALCRTPQAGRVELGKLHLHPEYQGKGLGRKMAEELIRKARSLGYKVLELHVTVTQAAAIGLYHRLGFVEAHRKVFTHTDGESYDTVFMDLAL